MQYKDFTVAITLCGPAGCGKSTFAQELAEAINKLPSLRKVTKYDCVSFQSPEQHELDGELEFAFFVRPQP